MVPRSHAGAVAKARTSFRLGYNSRPLSPLVPPAVPNC